MASKLKIGVLLRALMLPDGYGRSTAGARSSCSTWSASSRHSCAKSKYISRASKVTARLRARSTQAVPRHHFTLHQSLPVTRARAPRALAATLASRGQPYGWPTWPYSPPWQKFASSSKCNGSPRTTGKLKPIVRGPKSAHQTPKEQDRSREWLQGTRLIEGLCEMTPPKRPAPRSQLE